jgi:hypothetical protein
MVPTDRAASCSFECRHARVRRSLTSKTPRRSAVGASRPRTAASDRRVRAGTVVHHRVRNRSRDPARSREKAERCERHLEGDQRPMEGTSIIPWQRGLVRRTRRWRETLESAGAAHDSSCAGRTAGKREDRSVAGAIGWTRSTTEGALLREEEGPSSAAGSPDPNGGGIVWCGIVARRPPPMRRQGGRPVSGRRSWRPARPCGELDTGSADVLGRKCPGPDVRARLLRRCATQGSTDPGPRKRPSTRWWRHHCGGKHRIDLWARKGSPGGSRRRTARGEQAPAMEHGYRRGKTFEGYALVQRVSSTDPLRRPRRGIQNPANPRSGTGMQHARNPRCGGSRRGGAKPRGRNETPWWPHGPNDPGNEVAEWTPAGTSEEGNPGKDNPTEGSIHGTGGSGPAQGAPEVRGRSGGARTARQRPGRPSVGSP